MKHLMLVLPLLAGGCLAAGDLDIYLTASVLSPRKNLASEYLNADGQKLGRSLQLSSDFRQLGGGVAYSFLSFGPWRLKGQAEFTVGPSDPAFTLRYASDQGVEPLVEVTGDLQYYSVSPGISLVYRSSGLGEYGITLENRFQWMSGYFEKGLWSVAGPDTPAWVERKADLSDPFVSINATFVQQYQRMGFLARISYGINLKSPKKVGDFTEAQYIAMDEKLLEALRPRQEIKLSAGVRF